MTQHEPNGGFSFWRFVRSRAVPIGAAAFVAIGAYLAFYPPQFLARVGVSPVYVVLVVGAAIIIIGGSIAWRFSARRNEADVSPSRVFDDFVSLIWGFFDPSFIGPLNPHRANKHSPSKRRKDDPKYFGTGGLPMDENNRERKPDRDGYI